MRYVVRSISEHAHGGETFVMMGRSAARYRPGRALESAAVRQEAGGAGGGGEEEGEEEVEGSGLSDDKVRPGPGLIRTAF